MNTEKLKILEMLENGKITAQDAGQLLDALEPDRVERSGDSAGKYESSEHSKGKKKLRIYVVGDADEQKNMNIHVAVPLTLVRLVDNVVENCIPNEALGEMKKHGIDLKAIKLGDMIGTLENLEEDIVNVDVKSDNADFKVRVYVE